jgi:macrolide-specific efflux system membrane fusion protein
MPVSFTTFGHADRVWKASLREVLPVPQRLPRKSDGGDRSNVRSNIISYVALFDIENSDNALRAEMTAQVSFIYARAPDTVAIPAAAFQALGTTNAIARPTERQRAQVHVLNSDGKVSVRDVVTGVRGPRFIEAKSGIAVGERVIIGEARRPPRPSFSIER